MATQSQDALTGKLSISLTGAGGTGEKAATAVFRSDQPASVVVWLEVTEVREPKCLFSLRGTFFLEQMGSASGYKFPLKGQTWKAGVTEYEFKNVIPQKTLEEGLYKISVVITAEDVEGTVLATIYHDGPLIQAVTW